MRCVIFAAVSTAAQMGDDKESIPTQIADTRQLIEDREGWHEVHDPLIVEGQSRAIDWLDQATAELPALTKLLELADGGNIDLVVIRDFDRLARSQLLLDQIRFRLRQNNVQIYALNQPAEPVSPKDAAQQSDSAFLLESLGGLLAEWENRVRVRRVRVGIRGRVKRGLSPNNRLPYGYHMQNGEPAIVPTQAELVRHIFDRYLAGLGTLSIARELHALGHRTRYGKRWSSSTVAYIIKNPFYAGYVSLGRHRFRKMPSGRVYKYRAPADQWLIAEGKHPGIITRTTWQAVKQEHEKRKRFRPRTAKRTYPLSGLLRCGYCGGAMRIVFSKPDRAYYGCSRHAIDKECQSNMVRARLLEEQVVAIIKELMASPEAQREALSARIGQGQEQLEERKRWLEKQARQLQEALFQWTRDYEEGLLERANFYEYRGDTIERLDNVLADLTVVGDQLGRQDDQEQTRERLESLLSRHADTKHLTSDERRQLYHGLFSSLDIKDHKITAWESV